MGYGMDEDLGDLAADHEREQRLQHGKRTDFEKMLDWLNTDLDEFDTLTRNQQNQKKLIWRKFGRHELN